MSFNLLIVPGYHGSGDAHWQTWLESQIPTAKRITGINWEEPILHNWAKAIIRELEANPNPTVIVAHSFGCLASAMAIANRPQFVAGAILVAPADPVRFTLMGPRKGHLADYPSIAAHLPDRPLNMPGLVIGSRNDPWMKLQHAYAWAQRWGLAFHNAGHVGHINVDSGFGPWPFIKLITSSLYDFVRGNASRQSANALAYTNVNQLLPPPTLIFNQQHLLYA